MPSHMMIGLLRDDAKYPKEPPEHGNVGLDSECFKVDYESGDGPDPAGCRVFSKSFAPLKKLRTCIVKHLDSDPIWISRANSFVSDGSFNGTYSEWCKQAIWSYVGGGQLPVKLCSKFDSIRRAEEMIKFALFKPIPNDVAMAVEKIRSKIQFTVTWPKGQKGLTDSTVEHIQEECFMVQEGQELINAKYLQKIGICLPLMFDKAEVQGFGINDGIMKFQDLDYYADKVQDFHQLNTFPVPPLCGRLALATIPAFQSASYLLATWETLQNDRKPSYYECLSATSTNCRKAYFCWENALNRICGISPKCCPNHLLEAAADQVHVACKHNPDGAIITTEGWFDWRFLPRLPGLNDMCPRKMRTGNSWVVRQFSRRRRTL